jgi:hypothetical protein
MIKLLKFLLSEVMNAVWPVSDHQAGLVLLECVAPLQSLNFPTVLDFHMRRSRHQLAPPLKSSLRECLKMFKTRTNG